MSMDFIDDHIGRFFNVHIHVYIYMYVRMYVYLILESVAP